MLPKSVSKSVHSWKSFTRESSYNLSSYHHPTFSLQNLNVAWISVAKKIFSNVRPSHSQYLLYQLVINYLLSLLIFYALTVQSQRNILLKPQHKEVMFFSSLFSKGKKFFWRLLILRLMVIDFPTVSVTKQTDILEKYKN